MTRRLAQKKLMDIIQELIEEGVIQRVVATSLLKSIGSGINKNAISHVNFYLFMDKIEMDVEFMYKLTDREGTIHRKVVTNKGSYSVINDDGIIF